MRQSNAHLTGGRLLARNTIWNLLGQLLPMVVAVFTIPPLVHALGVDRFGILSLAWIVIGYFSLFDLGIGRALTKLISDKLGMDEAHTIPPLAWTSLALMFLLGLVGTAVTLSISPWLVRSALKVPVGLRDESLHSFYWLAISIPIVTVTAGLRGMLDALQCFRIANLIRIPMNVFSFVGPLLVLPFSHSLTPVIMVLVAGRMIGCLAHAWACLRAFPALGAGFTLDRSMVMPVLRFGGWMTVSNIIGPLMTYLDRFLIGGLLSLSAVAYYTAPYDAVSRLLMIPAATSGVLFPAFAFSLHQTPGRTELLLSRGTRFVFLAILPVVLTLVIFAREGLNLWLGPAFAENGSTIVRWLAAGVLVNSLAHAPFALIQSAGRPDLTAKLHVLELPVYLAALWLLTVRIGIEGAAIAWTVRLVLDAAGLWFFAHRLLPKGSTIVLKAAAMIAAGLSVLYAATFPGTLVSKGVFLFVSLVLFAIVGWAWLLDLQERAMLLGRRPALTGIESHLVDETAKQA
jgi:O-antigen/teichoic acid export membrane protein